ncbi:MAG TPA: aldose epimerase family protein [Clostridiaceae bacterium]
MSITKGHFGTLPDGRSVNYFTLKNSKGFQAQITNFGGILISLKAPDRVGKLEDVVLGYEKLEDYNKKAFYFGAIIGRHANRIANASFELDGKEYKLFKNEGENHLHGGEVGFDKVLWNYEVYEDSLELSYTSKDKEEGYPGNLKVMVIYTLSEENELRIEYSAVSDKTTVINLTNHSYFNLSGHASGDILKHKVWINADKFTVIDEASLPNGEFRDVKGTPLDFTSPTYIGDRINDSDPQMVFAGGYDHNYVLNTAGNLKEKAAEVYDEVSGRVMEVYTDKPGIQFYSGNFLDGSAIGKGGAVYNKRQALCLETQFFPNAMVHKNFPSPILKAGDTYNYTTIYKFSSR